MRIHAVNAFEGDCLLLESSGSFALIDGGPRGTFDKHLENHLDAVVGEGGVIEAVIVSHVDADHITGVLDVFAAVEADRADGLATKFIIKDLWHNSFARTLDNADGVLASSLQSMMSLAGRAQVAAANGSIALLGIAQGERLRRLALQLGVPLNKEFGSKLLTVEEAAGSWTFGDSQFRVVGPTAANLDALREEWAKWIDKNLDAFAAGSPDAMANADKSIPNLSSIVLLGSTPNGHILLTGDARGDHILAGLETSGALAPAGTLPLRLLKLQHHGSDRNMDRSFFERLPADIYLVSADGKYGNPDFETLALLLDVAKEQGRHPKLIATNAPATVQQLLDDRPPAQSGYDLFVRGNADDAIVVDLADGAVTAV